MIALGVDTNGDGNIQNSEVVSTTYLDISNANISNLTGIRSFLSLSTLNCSNNQVNSINLSGMNSLLNIDARNNQISVMNLSGTNNITGLEIGNNLFTTLNISALVNLKYLGCEFNQLTNLSVANLGFLEVIRCNNNLLATLNFNNCTSLNTVYCYNNVLTSLDCQSNSNLYTLICNDNLLSNLNIAGIQNLAEFTCKNNLLTNLDLTNTKFVGLGTFFASKYFDCSFNQLSSFTFSNTKITYFKCNNNQLTSLNLNNCEIIYELNCSNNQLTNINFGNSITPLVIANNNSLTTIDLSTCFYINSLDVSNNNLSTIFAKNGRNEYINFNNNPNLIYICADEEQISSFASVALPTTSVNSYCSFVPGGQYVTIAGASRFDNDSNGCDVNDAFFSNLRINVSDGFTSGATFTGNTGNYSIFSQSTDFTLTPVLENPTYFTATPATANLSFSNNNSTQIQDFCIAPNGIRKDLEIVLAPVGQAFIGQEASYILVYKNKGNQTLSGEITLSFDDDKADFLSSNPAIDSQLLNILTWNYSNLLPFESRTIQFKLYLNGIIVVNNMLLFTSTINPITTDEMPSDNVFELSQPAEFNYYPHRIYCLEGNNVDPSRIGQYLHYNIQFDSTGTAPASNIVLKTIIDTTKFDIGSLQVMNASANLRTVITNNIVEFIFENINLARRSGNPPVGGHGDVLFKIKTQANLAAGSSVMNNAGIYFDYNFPIITNDAVTTFATLSNQVFKTDASVSVSPNPATSIINVNCNSSIKSIELYDVQGRVLEIIMNANNLDISNKTTGIYFIKITTENGAKVEKIIKE